MSRGSAAPLALAFALLTAADAGASEWVEFDGCRLAANESNDGDSFHVNHKGREYVFRLYFVDAPETSELIPSRVREQAEAFETTKEKVLEAGRDASSFTRKKLGQDFKVVTRWEDARGMTEGGRHYAFVETAEGEDLGDLLLSAGLARSYGMRAATKSMTAAQLQQRYDRLEQKARRARAGIWGDGRGAAVALEDEVPSGRASGGKEAEGEGSEGEGSNDAMNGGLMDAALGATSLLVADDRVAAEPRPSPSGSPSPRASGSKAAPAPPRPDKIATGKTKLDLNKATKDELMALPGIDEVRAAAIIAARPLAGSFDLLRVPGIGPATLKEIYPYIEE